ncbi:MAG TPA: phosphotriesterase-related protein [Anaerolineae bacterium]|nr:phosphotriesterase-related protein [Anaerolineae bacterium]
MAKVRTVLGDVDPQEIGITLIHEHLFYDRIGEEEQNRKFVDLEVQRKELSGFQEQGGKCVVDQTTIDLGRQPKLLQRLAEETGLHIIASTGFYHEPWLPEIVRNADINQIAHQMINEIDEAIEGVDFRAGLIGEIGSTEIGTTAQEEKVLRAAARAHQATGAPISTHTIAGAEALHQIAILKEEGVELQKVIISHVDLDHVEHLCLIAEQGVFLGFDTIGKPRFRDEYRMTGDEIRLEVLCAMVKAGFEDQILLSHDISNPDYLSTNGGHGYIHLLGEFVPRLHDRLSETTIEKFIIHNPRRALEF